MVPFYSTLSTVFFRRRYVSWPRKVCSGEGAICFNQGGMFHSYHDARRPLLRPCNNKGKTPASSGYKSQRKYCTREGGVEKWRKHKENRGREKDLKIHRKQKTERGKNRGRTEEERASTYQLHHHLRPQATASPPAAPGNRGKRKKKQRGAGKKKEENRGRRGNTVGGRKKEREGDERREVKNKRQT